jgi:two-component system, chemotaxis family, protein-glutamate methylesterase/glutaminase
VAGDQQMSGHEIVVIGASAGGVETLRTIAAGLPADLPASVFVVLHLPPGGTSVLPTILDRAGDLPAAAAVDGEAIEPGRIYVAPPDHHLLVDDGVARIARGPRENGHRPAIDSLFRSAARSYGSRTIGIVLSGVLDDGTAGLATIKAAGGRTIVQDPDDALYPAMPRAAIAYVDPDHVVDAAAIPELVVRLAKEPPRPEADPPGGSDDVLEETLVAVDRGSSDQPQPGEPSGFTCPECSGGLWEARENGVPRFRCRTGHQFSLETLLSEQSESVEASLWSALRALEERAAMLRRIAQRMSSRGSRSAAVRYARNADHTVQQALVLRQALHGLHSEDDGTDATRESAPIEQVP